MIALIEIPHQRPPRINWFEDRAALENAAAEYAVDSSREEPKDFDEAVCCLADDWHGHILVESADDLRHVETYKGHRQLEVTGHILRELRENFNA